MFSLNVFLNVQLRQITISRKVVKKTNEFYISIIFIFNLKLNSKIRKTNKNNEFNYALLTLKDS
jgi:hypothetical protein